VRIVALWQVQKWNVQLEFFREKAMVDRMDMDYLAAS
jgi:hypothetical protein